MLEVGAAAAARPGRDQGAAGVRAAARARVAHDQAPRRGGGGMGELILPPAYRDDAASHPPLDYAGYGSTALRHPRAAAGRAAADADRADRPAARRRARAAVRRRPHAPARRRAARRAHHRARPRARGGRPAGARHARRGVAVQQRRALPARAATGTPRRSTPTSPGSGRCLTDADGRYRFVTIKPGAYPWGNHAQRLAAGAHPLLAVRARVHAAAGDADVLPRRPAVRPGPDLQLGPRPRRARADDLRVRPRAPPSRSGRSPTAGTSCCAGREATPPDEDDA